MERNAAPGFRPWNRYQWAGTGSGSSSPEVSRWNLVEWLGDNGGSDAGRRLPVTMPADHWGLCGFGHNPSGTHWADGYSR